MTYANVYATFLIFFNRMAQTGVEPLDLLTNTEFFDDSAVTLDVFCLQVIQHTTTLTYQCGQCALRTEVLAIVLQVLREVVDTEGEQSDLALSRTGVLSVVAVFCEQLCFFLSC